MMPPQGPYLTGDQGLVRRLNLAAIMLHLREHAPVSRAALASLTGLNKTTVSSLVHELIQQRFVLESGRGNARVGRPSTLLSLNPDAGFIVSAEIGVDFISVIRTNFAADVVWRKIAPLVVSADYIQGIESLLDLIAEACATRVASSGRLLGVAVGVPGLVDQESGNLLFAPNLGWQSVPLRSLLAGQIAAPILIDNEANLAALGEHSFGVAQGYSFVVYLSVGLGAGGGFVQGGQIYRGAAGFSGEFGHMTFNPDGEMCRCGNRGCWETQVDLAALFRELGRAIAAGVPSRLSHFAEADLSSDSLRTLMLAADEGDEAALQAFRVVGKALGVGAASLINALNPDLVVLGGMASAAARHLVPEIELELRRRALRWNSSAAHMTIAKHGRDACVMGGVAAVIQYVLAQPSITGTLPDVRQAFRTSASERDLAMDHPSRG